MSVESWKRSTTTDRDSRQSDRQKSIEGREGEPERMEAADERPYGGAAVRLHQEARQQRSSRKRKFRQEEIRRRGRGGQKENEEPANHLRRITESGEISNSRTKGAVRSKARTGLRPQIQTCRPEVRVALIRKTRSHQPVQVQGNPALIPKNQTDQGFTQEHLDQNQQTQITSDDGPRSTWGPALQRPAVPISGQSLETRTSGTDRDLEKRTGCAGRRDERETKKRRKIHPSVFRGRGQLKLSITPEAGQLILHIHEARGLMGKSRRSCDSYVKVDVTSGHRESVRMKTQMVLNDKNPKYDQSISLCVRGKLQSRLLVSVCRRLDDSRSSQLIGCMSFGISSLVLRSQLTDWFYLLNEDFGRSKHLRVTSWRCRPALDLKEETAVRDLRGTLDSAPDADRNQISTVSTSASNRVSAASSAGAKELGRGTLASSRPLSLDSANCISYMTTNSQQLDSQDLRVSILRGEDGFGFTICSDCPVRVQAVDPGGPAHLSGLRQGDSVMQLNGLPVETWKCVDLAHAIRSCPSQILLVVWRGLPEAGSGCDALLRSQTHSTMTGSKLLSHPSHSKHGRRWGQGLGVRSSLGALGSLWRDKAEEKKEQDEDQEVYSPPTATLKGTRVTSSNGDNYIILSPLNPGAQLLQPVYQDRNGTIGRLYQTHPSRGQNLLHNSRTKSSVPSFSSHTSTLPPPPAKTSSSTSPGNYGNYQNCTIVQSHLPRSGYGTYISLAPKTLIFPVFVQPLDLCSPDRTLLMSEEMILHQANALPAKVTVLIYSDLLLLTREDEAGRCNVLQSPLYLNTVKLREVSSEPLHIYFLQNSQSCWRCLFSLEAFNIEQKVRVRLCLHDNIQLQLVSTESSHSHQLSDLPTDFSVLPLGHDLLYRPSSPYSSLCDPLRPPSPCPFPPISTLTSSTPPPPNFCSVSAYISSSPPYRGVTSPPPSCSSTLRSPVWKERGEDEERRRRRLEEVEERQQGEGESASETSESVGGLLLSPLHLDMKHHDEEGEESEEEDRGGAGEFAFTCRPEVLRRSLSEGSLLQEPRSPRFLSDSTIHRLTRPTPFEADPPSGSTPCLPSPETLRKHLTSEEASLIHILALLDGLKGEASGAGQLRRNRTKSLAADVLSRFAFLRRWKNGAGIHGNSLEKALRNNRPSSAEVRRWADSLEALLTNQYGLAVFRHFLRSEFSEENLDFWLAVERFKSTRPFSKMAARAVKIQEEFISANAARQVNVDASVREMTNQSLRLGVNPSSFQLAQDQIFSLMETDSYPRFLKSRLYAQLADHNTKMAGKPESQSRCVSLA
ncbi:regulator of G-protein signaling 3 isoform X2 [Oryzias melastigma]|uniref:regulator of G-protein signaling 3 isoform X2 n=1 Tax=Oryzias melastigma TaxID=30732 RepID=UPI000CF7DFDA|nr:regulator of G-protein signaling 3 isoform X2 [Oryzias melastigma]